MLKLSSYSLLACLALAAAPLHADSVFVPLTAHQPSAGVTYRTEVMVANPGTTPLSFDVRFLAAGEDGTRAAAATSRSVAPGGTLVLTGLNPAGKAGMVEISGAPELAVSARLLATSKGRAVTSMAVPAVTSANSLAAGDTAQVQGLEKSIRMGSRLGVINLSEETAACTLQVFRADGSRLGDETRISLPPLSQRLLADSLGSIQVAEARAQVSCDRTFFAYALRAKVDGSETAFLSPSGRLGEGLVRASQKWVPGEDAEAVAEEALAGEEAEAAVAAATAKMEPLPGGGEGFMIPGVFLNATANDKMRAYNLPAAAGVRYRRVTVEWDLYVSRWQTTVFHGVSSLRRSGRKRADRVLYTGLQVRPDRKISVLDLGGDRLTRAAGPWKANTEYHLALIYDYPARRVTFQMWQGGRLVHQVSGRSGSHELRNLSNGRNMLVDFGMTGVADGAYFPPAPGWQYKNLVVRMTR